MPDPADRDILIQQLAAAPGDGVRVEAQEFRQHAVAAVAEFEGLQTGIQAALLLVQQAVKQDDGGFHFIGRHFQPGGIDHRGRRPTRGIFCRRTAEAFVRCRYARPASIQSDSYFAVTTSSFFSMLPISGLDIKYFHTRPVL